jgi:hypothetical protein
VPRTVEPEFTDEDSALASVERIRDRKDFSRATSPQNLWAKGCHGGSNSLMHELNSAQLDELPWDDALQIDNSEEWEGACVFITMI